MLTTTIRNKKKVIVEQIKKRTPKDIWESFWLLLETIKSQPSICFFNGEPPTEFRIVLSDEGWVWTSEKTADFAASNYAILAQASVERFTTKPSEKRLRQSATATLKSLDHYSGFLELLNWSIKEKLFSEGYETAQNVHGIWVDGGWVVNFSIDYES